MADTELREVYSAANIQEAHLIKIALETAGIEAQIVGDHLQNAVGDLPAVAIAPRVWVYAEQYDKARKIIADHQQSRGNSGEKSMPKWACRQCGEFNEPTFEICWNCQAARDGKV